jgi:hypothetical protein
MIATNSLAFARAAHLVVGVAPKTPYRDGVWRVRGDVNWHRAPRGKRALRRVCVYKRQIHRLVRRHATCGGGLVNYDPRRSPIAMRGGMVLLTRRGDITRGLVSVLRQEHEQKEHPRQQCPRHFVSLHPLI